MSLIRAEGIYVRARVAQLRSSRREERVGGLRRSEKNSERFGCGAVGDRVGGLRRSEKREKPVCGVREGVGALSES